MKQVLNIYIFFPPEDSLSYLRFNEFLAVYACKVYAHKRRVYYTKFQKK